MSASSFRGQTAGWRNARVHAQVTVLALVVAQVWAVFPARHLQGQEAAAVQDKPANPSKAAAGSAAEWLPDQTQGFARIVDFTRFLDHWNSTQLGKLGKHERLQEFWNEQQKEIEDKFAEAGWQLNLSGDDIRSIASGQVAVGWIAKAQQPQKPYSVALIVSVADKKEAVGNLLAKIDKELRARQATSKIIDYKGQKITEYTLPRAPGALVIRQSLYAVVDDYLLAADELPQLQALIDAKTSGLGNSLANNQLYRDSMKRLPRHST